MRKVPATDPGRAVPGRSDAALLICSHGSRGAGTALRTRARSLQRQGDFAEVAGCSLFGEPALERAVAGLSADTVYLVPLLMAEGITLDALKDRVAGLGPPGRLVLCRPVGSNPRLPDHLIAAAEAEALLQGWTAERTAVVLVGHGSWRSTASQRSTERLASAVAASRRFSEVAVALLENGADLAVTLANLRAEQAIVIGCFAEGGRHALEDVPSLLAGAPRPCVYLGPIGAAPWFNQLILQAARERAPVATRLPPTREAMI